MIRVGAVSLLIIELGQQCAARITKDSFAAGACSLCERRGEIQINNSAGELATRTCASYIEGRQEEHKSACIKIGDRTNTNAGKCDSRRGDERMPYKDESR